MNGFKVKIFTMDGCQTVSIDKAFLTIGKSAYCDINLEHQNVGEEHLRVWCEGGRLWAQDLGADAGTAMNDLPLPRLRPLLFRETDVFRLGDSPFTLTFEPNWIRPANVNKPLEQMGMQAPPSGPAKLLQQLEDEIEARRKEKRKLAKELAHLKLQRQYHRMAAPANTADSVADLKLSADQEVNAYKEAEMRKFVQQKQQLIEDLEKSILDKLDQKILTSKVSRSQISYVASFLVFLGLLAWLLFVPGNSVTDRQVASPAPPQLSR
jgi:hypothetical protein